MIHEFHTLVVTALTNYLRGLTLREALTTGADILIVYYVIYRVLKLIRGTRAAQMLVGVALIAALFFAAKRLELNTVSWLFENLINYVIILLIVIFQHDIQRGLIQVGQNLFRRRQYEETYVIEEVVQAADELSRHRIGGLFVLERDADLADHLGEAGVELDAKVTKELLVTLFIPDADNHMHDGAVILKNLRVQQAGALLPLSANAKLDKALGTRHRAAIGITEQTDAVVVVVSEERGQVSLCFNGNIARDLAPATLRKALLGLFQKKTKGKGPAARGPARGVAPGPTRPMPSVPTVPVRDAAGGRKDRDQALGPPLVGAPTEPAGPRGSVRPPGGPQPGPRPEADPDLLSLVVTQPLTRPVDLVASPSPAGPLGPGAPATGATTGPDGPPELDELDGSPVRSDPPQGTAEGPPAPLVGPSPEV